MATTQHSQGISWRKIILVLVAVYVFGNMVFGLTRIFALKQQQNAVTEDLSAAYSQQEQLQEEANYMQTDAAIEQIAREKLGLVKDGEVLVQRAESQQ